MSEPTTTFLYVALFWWGSREIHRYPMPDLTTCLKVASHVHFEGSPGDENEAGVATWCGPEGERWWNSTWWTDRRKDLSE